MLSITTVPSVPEQATSLTCDEFLALSVVDQLRRAFSPGHRLGAVIGAGIGGFVPVASYEIVHVEVLANPWLWALVAGALLFSGLSVFRWASDAFASTWKGAGFVVLCEGAMVLSRNHWLGLSALGLLVLINVCSCSCALQVRPDSTVTSDTSVTSLGLSAPSVMPSVVVNVAQQNFTRPSRTKSHTAEERKTANARRAREYRQRKRDGRAVQTA